MTRRSTTPDTAVVKTNPDPTEAVKEALTLAIKNLADRFDIQVAMIKESTITAATELKDKLVAMNLTIDGKFLANKDLVDQLAKANAVALSAALQTQKESAAKSEVSMADVLKQLTINFDTQLRGLQRDMSSLMDQRNVTLGGETGRAHTISTGYTAVMVLGTGVAIVAAIFALFHH